MAAKEMKNGVAWADELSRKYTAGISHVFVLHFNVRDYAHGLVSVEEYLKAMLGKRDMVISYDIAGGLTFATPEQRKLFIHALGLDQQPGGDLAAAMGLNVETPQDAEVELPRKPAEALALLERAMRLQEVTLHHGTKIHPKVAVILNWAEQLAPISEVAMTQQADRIATVTLAEWATDPMIMANQAIVILITHNLADLAEPLRASTSRIEAITVTLPDEATRLAWIEDYLAGKKSERDTEIEMTAWNAVRSAMAHSDEWAGWYWDEAFEFSWAENDLDNAPNPELRQQAKKLLSKARQQAGRGIPELKLAVPVEILARMTAGLSLVHVEDIFLRAMHEGRPVDRELVKDRKDSIIRSEFGDVLEIMDPQFGLDMIAGHKAVKRYFQEYVIRALREGDTARAPLGVLLMGPAGTGKSAIVEAMAFECGFNAVLFKQAKILGGLVGASERNQEKAFLAIEALAPCIVFTDEIDQAVGQRGGYQGDSGVSARLLGRMMEFMSDSRHRGRIVWLAATNRPDLLDSAFKRPGRFDAKIPMLMPVNDLERVELFEVMFRKYKVNLTERLSTRQDTLNAAAKSTAGYTGAEVESIVIKANQIAGRHGRPEGQLTGQDLLRAIGLISPSTRDIEFMTALALAEVNDLEFVPEVYRKRAADKPLLESEIESWAPKARGAREL